MYDALKYELIPLRFALVHIFTLIHRHFVVVPPFIAYVFLSCHMRI